jgi:hypothetical protein
MTLNRAGIALVPRELAGYEGKADGDDPAADRHTGRACDRTRGGVQPDRGQRREGASQAKAEQVNKARRFFQTA